MTWLLWWIAAWIKAWLTQGIRKRCGQRRGLAFVTSIRTQAKPAWVIREIIRLKALMPDAGCGVSQHCR